MALKLLLFLSLLNVVFSVPAPDPDPDIRIDVQQIVNVGDCCPEITCGNQKTCTYMGQNGVCSREEQPPFNKNVGRQECEDDCECYIVGCVFGVKVYPIGAMAQGTCINLECIEGDIIGDGVWNYKGNIDTSCGNCTVYGDPHFITYDPHNLTNPPSSPSGYPYNGNPITEYESPSSILGEHVISQYGLDPVQSLFGVYGKFTTCDYEDITGTCVSRASYSEPGIEVELILPVDYDTTYCQTAPTPDPKCETKIYVNGEERSIADGGSVSTFSGTDGTVLIFKDGPCNSQGCQIYVVGSKGITVYLKVDPEATDVWYYINIHPLPSLRGLLYGLCDKYTRADTTSYTLQDGSLMTNWSTANIDGFIDSWKVPS